MFVIESIMYTVYQCSSIYSRKLGFYASVPATCQFSLGHHQLSGSSFYFLLLFFFSVKKYNKNQQTTVSCIPAAGNIEADFLEVKKS